MKTKEPLFHRSTWAGLLALLFAVALTVIASAPREPLPSGRLLLAHEAILYFIDAETMAKTLFPNPAARWSHYPLDPGVICAPLKNGVWYAQGAVALTVNGQEFAAPWEVYFLPGQTSALYARVGDFKSGDRAAARRMAGLPETNPQDAAHGR